MPTEFYFYVKTDADLSLAFDTIKPVLLLCDGSISVRWDEKDNEWCVAYTAPVELFSPEMKKIECIFNGAKFEREDAYGGWGAMVPKSQLTPMTPEQQEFCDHQ